MLGLGALESCPAGRQQRRNQAGAWCYDGDGGRLRALGCYEAAMGPVLEALEETGEVIDQIVYELCGLTGEEIGIARGAVGG